MQYKERQAPDATPANAKFSRQSSSDGHRQAPKEWTLSSERCTQKRLPNICWCVLRQCPVLFANAPLPACRSSALFSLLRSAKGCRLACTKGHTEVHTGFYTLITEVVARYLKCTQCHV